MEEKIKVINLINSGEEVNAYDLVNSRLSKPITKEDSAEKIDGETLFLRTVNSTDLQAHAAAAILSNPQTKKVYDTLLHQGETTKAQTVLENVQVIVNEGGYIKRAGDYWRNWMANGALYGMVSGLFFHPKILERIVSTIYTGHTTLYPSAVGSDSVDNSLRGAVEFLYNRTATLYLSNCDLKSKIMMIVPVATATSICAGLILGSLLGLAYGKIDVKRLPTDLQLEPADFTRHLKRKKRVKRFCSAALAASLLFGFADNVVTTATEIKACRAKASVSAIKERDAAPDKKLLEQRIKELENSGR